MRACSTLSSAVAEGDIKEIQQTINRERFASEAVIEGKSVVHVACLRGHNKAVALLLSKGFRADLKDLNNRTALHEAASRGHIKTIRRLLEKGAAINAKHDLGWTPLHEAAACGKNKAVSLLVEKGADMTMRNYHGCTAFHEAAASGSVRSVRYFCNKGMYIDETDGRCRTALHDAVSRGHMKTIAYLLNNGADVHANDNLGRTPLHIAAAHGKKKAIVLLVNKGAHVNAQNSLGNTPLYEAAREGQFVFGVLSKKGACMNAKNVLGLTPLHVAAARGDVEIVNSLVDEGAGIHVKDDKGHTALHDAIVRGDARTANCLLSKRESVYVRDSQGCTSFHRTVSSEAKNTICRTICQRSKLEYFNELIERFSRLPSELQLIVVEQFGPEARLHDFLEYDKILEYKEACSELVDTDMVGVEKAWIHWLKVQAAGVALCFFSGTKKQVKFLIKHVKVLQRLAISVGIVFHNGAMRGYLVKETGRIPVCHKSNPLFSSECRIGVAKSNKDVRRSYLVVQAYGALGSKNRFAAVGTLTKETLKRAFGPALQLVHLNKCNMVDKFATIRLAHGGWVSEFCRCTGNIGSESVCLPCLEYHPFVQDFVLVTQPAERPWNCVTQLIKGNTDAMDSVTHVRADRMPMCKCGT